MSTEEVTVHVQYQQTEQTFTGDANQVWASINKFFSEMIPALQTVRKVLLTVDLEKLIEDCKNIIAITHEGPVLLVSKQKLTDSETLMLYLLSAYIGSKLGKSTGFLTRKELQAALGKNSKITGTRLSELIREGYATKTAEGNYQTTTLGIKRFQEELMSEIKGKMQR